MRADRSEPPLVAQLGEQTGQESILKKGSAKYLFRRANHRKEGCPMANLMAKVLKGCAFFD